MFTEYLLLSFEEKTLITSDDFTFACLFQETLEEARGHFMRTWF